MTEKYVKVRWEVCIKVKRDDYRVYRNVKNTKSPKRLLKISYPINNTNSIQVLGLEC